MKMSVMTADAASPPRSFGFGLFPRFSHDASRLIFASDRTGDNDIQYIPIAAGGASVRFQATSARETQPVPSFDGRWLAYTSNETGRNEVYVRRFPDASGLVPISQSGGVHPRWRKDGTEVYFRNGAAVMAASVRVNGDRLVADAPRQLFTATPDLAPESLYDVTADGQRFLMVRSAQDANATTTLLLTENWLAAFERNITTR
jgi:Tol biopolymer transport system component